MSTDGLYIYENNSTVPTSCETVESLENNTMEFHKIKLFTVP